MARGPGQLDFANQPDPFRRYIGAPQFRLEKKGLYDPVDGQKAPASVDMRSISVLFLRVWPFPHGRVLQAQNGLCA